MLTLVESRKDKIEAHKTLDASLEKVWPKRETRVVVWRPDSVEMTIHHNGHFGLGHDRPIKTTRPRGTGSRFASTGRTETFRLRWKLMSRRIRTKDAYRAFSQETRKQAPFTSCTTGVSEEDKRASASGRF